MQSCPANLWYLRNSVSSAGGRDIPGARGGGRGHRVGCILGQAQPAAKATPVSPPSRQRRRNAPSAGAVKRGALSHIVHHAADADVQLGAALSVAQQQLLWGEASRHQYFHDRMTTRGERESKTKQNQQHAAILRSLQQLVTPHPRPPSPLPANRHNI